MSPTGSICPTHTATEFLSTPPSYGKDGAIGDLVTILRSRPSDAGPDHPLCEMRMSAWGPYHRFPSKFATITLLAKMLGWAQPTQVQIDHDPDAGYKHQAALMRWWDLLRPHHDPQISAAHSLLILQGGWSSHQEESWFPSANRRVST